MRPPSSPQSLPYLPSEIQQLIMEHVRRLEARERLLTLEGLLDDVVSCLGVQTTSTHEWAMSVAPFDMYDVLAWPVREAMHCCMMNTAQVNLKHWSCAVGTKHSECIKKWTEWCHGTFLCDSFDPYLHIVFLSACRASGAEPFGLSSDMMKAYSGVTDEWFYLLFVLFECISALQIRWRAQFSWQSQLSTKQNNLIVCRE